MNAPHQFAAIGECMVELSPTDTPDRYALGFAGDSYNTAAHLAAHFPRNHNVHVNYLTSVGQEKFSIAMLEEMAKRGVKTDLIYRCPVHHVGLYVIENDATGERTFTYYRDQSAAKRLFLNENSEKLLAALPKMDWVYFTGITLAVTDLDDAHTRFEAALARSHHQQTRIAFDSNYRARLWPSVEVAKAAYARFLPFCQVVLSTFEDEHALFADATPQDAIARLTASYPNIEQLIIKHGSEAAYCWDKGENQSVPALPVDHVTDTTGAGDAFNAGVLAGLIEGLSLFDAARMGHGLAAETIQHRGALPPLPG